MNAKSNIIKICLFVCLMSCCLAAESVDKLVEQANNFYEQGRFKEAMTLYDKALTRMPDAGEPKFNKANSFYRLEDFSQAMDLYRQTAAQSTDMQLVTKAKYNLGNSHFETGKQQAQADLNKAIEQLKTAIGYWRQVLDIEPENEKAAKNIEVARITIKDWLDRQQNQQDPNQPQDPNQSCQQDKQQQQQQSGSDKDDPNQPTQPQQQDNDISEPNEPQQQEPQQQEQEQQPQEPQEEQEAPDTTAQEILDREQKQREQRQMMQRMRYEKVEMDW